jgi:hypothetical protein
MATHDRGRSIHRDFHDANEFAGAMKGRVSVIFRRGIAIAGWRSGDMRLSPRRPVAFLRRRRRWGGRLVAGWLMRQRGAGTRECDPPCVSHGPRCEHDCLFSVPVFGTSIGRKRHHARRPNMVLMAWIQFFLTTLSISIILIIGGKPKKTIYR